MTQRLLLRTLQILLSPLLAACALERRCGGGERAFAGCGELLALVPGWPGSAIRKAFYAATLRGCADRCYIGFGTLVAHRESSIGSDVYIGPYCILGTVRVGDGVKIASRVSIPSGRHQHAMADGGASSDPTFEEMTVGAGAWIGEGAVVLASVGRGAVVGAGSVVVRAVPEGATVAGNPAREIAPAARIERDPARALSS